MSDDASATHPHDLGSGHDAGGGSEALGPIDPLAWSAGVLGVILGLVVAACFVLATAGLGAF